jgi:hypothetical protein
MLIASQNLAKASQLYLGTIGHQSNHVLNPISRMKLR